MLSYSQLIEVSGEIYAAMEESDVVVLFNNHLSYKNLDISKIVSKIKNELIDLMKIDGFSNIKEIVGKEV